MKKFLQVLCIVFSVFNLTVTPQLLAQEASSVVIGQTVNVNKADAAELAEKLVGVGQSRAVAIIDYRETNGPFKSLEDLMSVKGLGQSFIEKNKDRIAF